MNKSNWTVSEISLCWFLRKQSLKSIHNTLHPIPTFHTWQRSTRLFSPSWTFGIGREHPEAFRALVGPTCFEQSAWRSSGWYISSPFRRRGFQSPRWEGTCLRGSLLLDRQVGAWESCQACLAFGRPWCGSRGQLSPVLRSSHQSVLGRDSQRPQTVKISFTF